MATEFDDSLHYATFKRAGAIRSGNAFDVRWSEITLASLRAAGFLDNMVDGLVPPSIDMLWLDKTLDPAVLKEWDPVGSNWEPVTSQTLFGRVPWRGPWNSMFIYRRGDLVERGGNIWIAALPSQNRVPDEDAYWDLFIAGATVADSSITTPKIAPKAVTADKVGDGVIPFATRAAAVAASIGATIHSVMLHGDGAEGDGLGGLFIDTNNGSSDTFVSNGGSRTWYRAPDVSRRRLKDKIVFTPQDYLSTAGTTFSVDATAAINSAIAAANAVGGVAYVPKGSYGISGTGLLILEGSRIDLHSAAVLRRLTVGEIWRNWVAGGAYAGRTAPGNWKIRGGVFDVRGSALGAGVTYSVANICQAKNILFEGCVFQDVYGGHCVDLAGCMDAHFVRCVFKDFTMQSGREFSEAIQVDIVSNTGFPDGMDPSTYNGATCQGVFVTECVFENYPTAVGSHGYGTDGFTDYYHELIFIKDCICRSMSYESFRPQRWRLFDIDGVAASGSSGRAFIRIDSCTEFTVSDFKWNGPTIAPPIQVTKSAVAVYDAKNWSIGPGSVTGSTNHGALLFSMNGGTLRGINIDGAGSASNGLVLDGCTDMVVDDVEIHDVGASNAAIRLLNTCQRVRINNPRISGAYAVGVLVEGNSADCVIDTPLIRDMASGRIGVRLAGSSRAVLRDGKVIGSGGTGVDVTSGATNAWVDGMDLRGLGGATKIVVAGGTTIVNSNNQV